MDSKEVFIKTLEENNPEGIRNAKDSTIVGSDRGYALVQLMYAMELEDKIFGAGWTPETMWILVEEAARLKALEKGTSSESTSEPKSELDNLLDKM